MVSPPKNDCPHPNPAPGTCNCDLIWKKDLCKCN